MRSYFPLTLDVLQHYEPHHENLLFAYAKTKAFVFDTWIVLSHYFLNLKFHVISHLLYSLTCVGPGQKPKDMFSNEAHILHVTCSRVFYVI